MSRSTSMYSRPKRKQWWSTRELEDKASCPFIYLTIFAFKFKIFMYLITFFTSFLLLFCCKFYFNKYIYICKNHIFLLVHTFLTIFICCLIVNFLSKLLWAFCYLIINLRTNRVFPYPRCSRSQLPRIITSLLLLNLQIKKISNSNIL